MILEGLDESVSKQPSKGEDQGIPEQLGLQPTKPMNPVGDHVEPNLGGRGTLPGAFASRSPHNAGCRGQVLFERCKEGVGKAVGDGDYRWRAMFAQVGCWCRASCLSKGKRR